jgi:hypothetical protein
MEALPDVIFPRVVNIRIVVVLPAPFGPRRPKTSPGGMERFNRSTAVRSPKRFVKSRVWIIGAVQGRRQQGKWALSGRLITAPPHSVYSSHPPYGLKQYDGRGGNS